jgi:hypothetical protein
MTRWPSTTGPSVTNLGLRHVLRIHHHHELAYLFGADGRVWHDEGVGRLLGGQANAAEHAGRQHAIGVRELCAAANGAGRAVDGIVDEVEAAFASEVLLIQKLQMHFEGAGPLVSPARRAEPLIAQERGFIEGEFETDGIGGGDGGEQRRGTRGASGHEVAFRHAPVADAAGDWRCQFGISQIELRLAQCRFLRFDFGLGNGASLLALIERLLGDGGSAHQFLTALQIAFGECQRGLGLHQRRLGPVTCGFQRPPVDRQQRIARLDELTVLEVYLFKVARDAAAHLDEVDGDEPADVFVGFSDAFDGRLGDRHLRRGWSRRLSHDVGLIATGQNESHGRNRTHASAAQGVGRASTRGGCVGVGLLHPVYPFLTSWNDPHHSQHLRSNVRNAIHPSPACRTATQDGLNSERPQEC